MRLEMSFQPTIKEILFTLFYFAGEVKLNLVSGVAQEKQPI